MNARMLEKAKRYVVVLDAEIPATAYVGSPRLVNLEHATDLEREVVESDWDATLYGTCSPYTRQ